MRKSGTMLEGIIDCCGVKYRCMGGFGGAEMLIEIEMDHHWGIIYKSHLLQVIDRQLKLRCCGSERRSDLSFAIPPKIIKNEVRCGFRDYCCDQLCAGRSTRSKGRQSDYGGAILKHKQHRQLPFRVGIGINLQNGTPCLTMLCEYVLFFKVMS